MTGLEDALDDDVAIIQRRELGAPDIHIKPKRISGEPIVEVLPMEVESLTLKLDMGEPDKAYWLIIIRRRRTEKLKEGDVVGRTVGVS
jgi:hypothetical protein